MQRLNIMKLQLASFIRFAAAISVMLAVSISAHGTEARYEGYDPKTCTMWGMTGTDFEYSNTLNNKKFSISSALRSSATSAVQDAIAQKLVPQFYEGRSFGLKFSRKNGAIGTEAPRRSLYCMYDDRLKNIKCTVETGNGLVSYQFDLQTKPEIHYRCSGAASACPVPMLIDVPEEDAPADGLYRRTLADYKKQCTVP